MKFSNSKLSGSVLLALALGCGDGSGADSRHSNETSSDLDADGVSESENTDMTKTSEVEVSSISTCCLADGSAAVLIFTPEEFEQLGEQLQWSEDEQISAEHSRGIGQRGLDILCGIENPVDREEDIARWTEQMLKSAEFHGGQEYRAALESNLGTCAP